MVHAALICLYCSMAAKPEEPKKFARYVLKIRDLMGNLSFLIGFYAKSRVVFHLRL